MRGASSGSVDSMPAGARGGLGSARSARARRGVRLGGRSSRRTSRSSLTDRVADLHRRAHLVHGGPRPPRARAASPPAGCPTPCPAAPRTPAAGRGSPPAARSRWSSERGPCSPGSRCRPCGSPAAAHSCVSVGENALCRSKTGQMSGLPGSVRRLRAGSVTIGLIFCAHDLRRVLQVDRVAVGLRHLAAVGARHARGRGEQRLRLREDRAVEVVEAAHDLARQLDVRGLVLPHRHRVRLVDHDVRALQQRIAEEAVGGEVLLRELLLLLLVASARARARARASIIESSRCSSACSGTRLWMKSVERAGSRPGGQPVRGHLEDVLADRRRGRRSRW